ncbi:unnamed protein product [Chrysoparadoxa australica]
MVKLRRVMTAVSCYCGLSLAYSPVMVVTGQKRSRAIPFAPLPTALEAAGDSIPGNYGFDPLGFSSTDNLDLMREAELKHGRLAMVALGAWPFSELFLATAQRLIPPSSVCTGNGCAIDSELASRSLPLAAIGKISLIYWGSALALAALAEIGLAKRREMLGDDYKPGDLGLDPFNLANETTRLQEVKHGRLAMAAFAVHYALVLADKTGVVFGHQLWGEVCVVNLRADLGFPPPICYPSAAKADSFDATLSYEIMWRVLTGYFKEPYY